MQKIWQVAVLTAFSTQLFAGGFWIEVGNGAANPEARSKDALLVARVSGCHDPSKAVVTGTAEGIVNGRRESVALSLIPLSTPGLYAVKRNWPSDGRWAVKLVATNDGRVTGVLLRMEGDGLDLASVKRFTRIPTPDEIDSILAGKSVTASSQSRP